MRVVSAVAGYSEARHDPVYYVLQLCSRDIFIAGNLDFIYVVILVDSIPSHEIY